MTALTRAILGVRERKGIVIVIAHRPSAIAGVDQILVMHARPHAGPRPEGRSAVESAATAGVSAAPLKVVPGERECERMTTAIREWFGDRFGAWENAAPAGGARASIRRHLIAGVLIVLLLGGGVGGWAATIEISGALIAQGSVVVDQNVQKVQHPTGGIVGELLVHDGDHVKAGDILVRLDETVMRANLAIVTKGLDELMARKARLEAERDGNETITFPAELAGAHQRPGRQSRHRQRKQIVRAAPHRTARPEGAIAAAHGAIGARKSPASRRSRPPRRKKST